MLTLMRTIFVDEMVYLVLYNIKAEGGETVEV